MTMALQGLTIVDLSRLLPGPLCTMVLADMGAEVIKVEEVEIRAGMIASDVMSRPGLTPEQEERWLAHNSLARNKKSLALDLRLEDSKQVFYKLVASADIVVESYRPGIAQRLGVDYASLRNVNPKIVYCSITGYGQDGPYRDRPGHNANFCSVAGVVGLGDWAGNAHVPGVPVADIAGGLYAAIGILCALVVREKTGKGQYVDIALTDCALSYVLPRLGAYLVTSMMLNLPSLSVVQNLWQTKDGKNIMTANFEPHFWERFCHALGRQDLLPGSGVTGKELNEVHTAISDIFLTKNRDEWVRELSEANTCVSPVLTLPEVTSDPQLLHRQMIVELEHPKAGRVKQLGIAVKLSETPGEIRSFAPRVGQHTEEILKRLGYTEEHIEELERKGIVRITS